MSQEKVNRHKEEKKNRKKNARKAKRTNFYINLFLIAAALIICVFLGWSVYAEFFREETPQKTVYNLSDGEIANIIDRNANENEEEEESVSDDANDNTEDNETEPESAAEGETAADNSAE